MLSGRDKVLRGNLVAPRHRAYQNANPIAPSIADSLGLNGAIDLLWSATPLSSKLLLFAGGHCGVDTTDFAKGELAAHPPRNRQLITGEGTEHVSILTGIWACTTGTWGDRAG